MASENLHAPRERLSTETLTLHQAIVSVMEELEAVDWYAQRADDCEDAALRQVLLHNRDEEIEHACMVLEWLRRNHPVFAEEMQTYLFTDGPITALEGQATGETAAAAPNDAKPSRGGLTVGALKNTE